MGFAIEKILFATDLSTSAKSAARTAAGLADKMGAAITVLHVIPLPADEITASMGNGGEELSRTWRAMVDEGLANTRKAMDQRIKKTMEEACREAGAEGVKIDRYVMDTGNPVEKIVQRAEKGGFDLVVMGTHGHTAVDRTRLGSVAAGVVRRCPKSVLVVRLEE